MAWYNGVAYLWEESAWKDDFNSKTEQIALVVPYSANDDTEWQTTKPKLIQEIRKWLLTIPSDEHHRLHELATEFSLAVVELTGEVLSAKLEGGPEPVPESIPSIASRVKRFEVVYGYAAGWRKTLKDLEVFDEIDPFKLDGERIVDLSNVSSSDDDIAIDESSRRLRLAIRLISKECSASVAELFQE